VNGRGNDSKIVRGKLMVQMTVQLPDDLAVKIQPLDRWLPAILKLSLLGCKTMATVTATELLEFLLRNPTPKQFLNYHVSDRAQMRLRRLLALNEAGLLSEEEQLELDELERLEHLVVMLKAQVAKQLKPQP
jgi:hypothetical protein